MKTQKIAKRFGKLLTLCTVLCVLMLACAAVSYADTPLELSFDNILLMGHCDAVVDGNTITVTDEDFNEDVWSSKILFDTGLDFTPGEQYTISFELTGGENGVGELFLCKGETLDIRYDETFTNVDGNRTLTFTPIQDRVYIGMQVGSLGYDNTVTAKFTNLCKLSESDCPALLRAENCDVCIENGVITATDNSDSNDVWNSKVLYDPGIDLEIGKTYRLSFDLAGENGVGEFFVCKSQDLNDRYDSTFVNYPCSSGVVFKAETEKLYIGIQFGNIGKGNTVTAGVGELGGFLPDAPEKEPDFVNCTYTVNGNEITVTDGSISDDVWESRLVLDLGHDLVPGKQYAINFDLSGDNGVGEFFLCKSKNINDRYDESFTNAPCKKTVIFTAEDTKAYIGMQMGNLGFGNSAKLTISEVKEYDEAAAAEPDLMLAQNCSYVVDNSGDNTVITGTDTGAESEIWTSKIIYSLGQPLEEDSMYAAYFNLAGDDGVGEFFFLKSNDINDRYDEPDYNTYTNTAGDKTVIFIAEDSALYTGMQFGDIGEGNDVTATIYDVYRIPGRQVSSEGCTDALGHDSVTLTDTGSTDEVWNSKAVYDTGKVLESGTEYTATVTLSGDNGVGEFFFLKSDNINNIGDRYSYNNTAGTHTINFTADGTALFFGIQCGNIGLGNSMTVSDLTVVPTLSQQVLLMGSTFESPETEQAAPEEEAAPAEEPAAEEESAGEEVNEVSENPEPVEEPVVESVPVVNEEPAPESQGE